MRQKAEEPLYSYAAKKNCPVSDSSSKHAGTQLLRAARL
jgi:hypothetical protein